MSKIGAGPTPFRIRTDLGDTDYDAPLIHDVRLLFGMARAGAGIVLDGGVHLPDARIRELEHGITWRKFPDMHFSRDVTGEREGTDVSLLRTMAIQAGLVAVRDGRLIPTSRGNEMLTGPPSHAYAYLLNYLLQFPFERLDRMVRIEGLNAMFARAIADLTLLDDERSYDSAEFGGALFPELSDPSDLNRERSRAAALRFFRFAGRLGLVEDRGVTTWPEYRVTSRVGLLVVPH